MARRLRGQQASMCDVAGWPAWKPANISHQINSTWADEEHPTHSLAVLIQVPSWNNIGCCARVCVFARWAEGWVCLPACSHSKVPGRLFCLCGYWMALLHLFFLHFFIMLCFFLSTKNSSRQQLCQLLPRAGGEEGLSDCTVQTSFIKLLGHSPLNMRGKKTVQEDYSQHGESSVKGLRDCEMLRLL